MEYDPIKLEALLDLLVQSGVEEFEGFGFHVRFTTAMFTPDKMVSEDSKQIVEVQDHRPEPRSTWDDPRLWPGGRKPEFPNNK